MDNEDLILIFAIPFLIYTSFVISIIMASFLRNHDVMPKTMDKYVEHLERSKKMFIAPFKAIWKGIFWLRHIKIRTKDQLMIDKNDLIFFNNLKKVDYFSIAQDMSIEVYTLISSRFNLYHFEAYTTIADETNRIKDMVNLDQDLDILKKSLNSVKKFNL